MNLRRFSLANLPMRQQLIIYGLFVLAGGYLAYSTYVQPLRAETSALSEKVGMMELEIQQGQLVQAKLPEFQKEVVRQEALLRQFRETLPDEKETSELMRRLEELAVESRLSVKSFTPQKTVTRDFYVDWPILISLEGSYHNLGEFFEKVAELTRLVNIDNLSIRSITDSDSRGPTISATFTATTFVFLEGGETP